MTQRPRALALGLFSAVLLLLPLSAQAASTGISNVTATPSNTSVTVQWTTDVAASSQVQYGTTSSYGTTTTETDLSPLVTQHSVTVSGLQTCTTYHFQAISNPQSYAASSITSDDVVATTAGCAAAASPTSANTALPNTGDNTLLYAAGAIALFLLGLSVSQLAKQRSR